LQDTGAFDLKTTSQLVWDYTNMIGHPDGQSLGPFIQEPRTSDRSTHLDYEQLVWSGNDVLEIDVEVDVLNSLNS
jgi:hypothetical protein